MPEFLRVALPVPLPKLFDYLLPQNVEVQVGARVRVPFARGQQVGLVVAISDHSELPASRLKPISEVLDPQALLDAELLSSLAWAADYWLGAPGDVYLGALPVALRSARPLPEIHEQGWALTVAGRTALDAGTRRGHAKSLLAALVGFGASRAATLDAAVPGWRSATRRLLDAGLITRQNVAATPMPAEPGPQRTDEQQRALDAVAASHGRFNAFLLDGVTGSGKTEVYLGLMEQVLSAGKQALLLVPEIGLAPQALQRLTRRLGVPVEVLHSNLAAGDRARAWLRAREGQARVIVGTRSAIFTPLPNAGLIVVDEEHDTSYKQQEGFRYHARDLAVVRARALGVPVLLGSATPSLESLANVEAGRYQRLHLSRRPAARLAPSVRVLDLRGLRLQHGLSPALLQALDACVERGEQALVFRNRRGYAPVWMCRTCGWHAECPYCDKPMTLHQSAARLLCHHCGQRQPVRRACPQCAASPLHAQGFGTERLEEALTQRYPGVPVLRVDSESTRRRDAFGDLLRQLEAAGPVILVGTQMLAKGHDLPGLTLVAITGVDAGLYSVDYRAGERLAQLIVQVAGRAGRADKPGEVLLQTHHPQHPLLTTLLKQGYSALSTQLLQERRDAALPPDSHQALLRAEAEQGAAVDDFLAAAAASLPADVGLRVLGPLPAPMQRRAGRQRGQLLLEADQRAALHRVLATWHPALGKMPQARRVRWSVDVDPVDLY